MTLICCRNVSKIYGTGPSAVRALKDVSLSIAAGENLAIVGHSGSGKSTLLQILGCLDRPTGGEYLLQSQNIDTLSDDALSELRGRTIGFVFQAFHLFPRMTLEENVALPLYYQSVRTKERLERAREALVRVGLGHRLRHRPHELSGGEKQRGAIARAIVHRPPLILADEPTGNLDSAVKMEILSQLRALNETMGVTIVTVTHDEDTARMASRLIRVRDGEVSDDVRT